MNFKPTVLVFESAKEFRWIGKMLFKGVFEGYLIPIFKRKMLAQTKTGYEEMNQALKVRVEKEY